MNVDDPEQFIILITGSRTWNDAVTIEQTILDEVLINFADRRDPNAAHNYARFVTIRHGGAMGTDAIASEIAQRRGFVEEVHRPEYDRYSPRIAPLRRNDKMVSLNADICLGFRVNGSRGTTYTLERAARFGIRMRVLDATFKSDGSLNVYADDRMGWNIFDV